MCNAFTVGLPNPKVSAMQQTIGPLGMKCLGFDERPMAGPGDVESPKAFELIEALSFSRRSDENDVSRAMEGLVDAVQSRFRRSSGHYR